MRCGRGEAWELEQKQESVSDRPYSNPKATVGASVFRRTYTDLKMTGKASEDDERRILQRPARHRGLCEILY